MKLILDTNTALSALFKPESRAATIIQMWRDNAFEWLSCAQQLEELTRVLARPKYFLYHAVVTLVIEV